jgi:hypothetical protein
MNKCKPGCPCGCELEGRDCVCHDEEVLQEPVASPDIYLVYPDDDGYDTPKNPYSQV